MRPATTGFFACKGYALVALGALAWAARSLEQQDGDAAAALAWVRGEQPQQVGALSFVVCVQAIGLSSRREQLRETFARQPQEAMAQLLAIEQAQGEDEGALLPEDEVDVALRLMRSFHTDGATPPQSPNGRPGNEQPC